MKRFLMLSLSLLLLLCGCRPAAIPAETTKPPVATTLAPTEPQLYIEFSREGEFSRIPVDLAHGTVGNYTIGCDPERFTQDGDVFHDHVWGEAQPHVYYAVSYFPDMTAQELAQGLQLQCEGDFATAEMEETTIGPYAATALYFGKDDALMTQQHFFAIDSPYGGSYLLETQFVMEMYEGLYPQIRAVFDTFTIYE